MYQWFDMSKELSFALFIHYHMNTNCAYVKVHLLWTTEPFKVSNDLLERNFSLKSFRNSKTREKGSLSLMISSSQGENF